MLDSVTQETLDNEIHRLCDLFSQGSIQETLDQTTQLLKRFPETTALYIIAGDANTKLQKFDAAITSYTNAIKLKPDFAVSHFNLGVALQDKGDFETALQSYKRAIAIKPDYLAAHYNIAVSFGKIGFLENSVKYFLKTIRLDPYHHSSWNNLLFPLHVLKNQNSNSFKNLMRKFELLTNKKARTHLDILKYDLSRGSLKAEKAMDKAIAQMPQGANFCIKNPNIFSNHGKRIVNKPKRIFALFQTGRAGTGLLHSLIDGHSKVSTLPSIYFSEYFDHTMWEKITAGGWKEMAMRFVKSCPVLFDARNPSPVLSIGGELISNIGQSEGLCNLGEERNEVLTLDKNRFYVELKKLISSQENLNALTFFELVHDAYDETIYKNSETDIIFYHIHNPSNCAQLNFTRLASNLNCILMVREPVQSCESWVKLSLEAGNYEKILHPVITMLFEVDNLIFNKNRSIGIRLEDLKNFPKKTVRELCKWMGIKEEKSLYEMTCQGKKWWGNQMETTVTMEEVAPFDKSSISRAVGEVFSERDQFILRTLFYPFRVHFDYVEANEEVFLKDLLTIRPMLDQMFDFEKMYVEKHISNPKRFKESVPFLYVRERLIERWKTLKNCKTYPNMINPMKISLN
ncbi:MAG: tetratricopeptide repeat protein [Paracoccaceae bacterium]|nr:tetratricopeptide repeat protein [Paracoccaceae bacterium]